MQPKFQITPGKVREAAIEYNKTGFVCPFDDVQDYLRAYIGNRVRNRDECYCKLLLFANKLNQRAQHTDDLREATLDILGHYRRWKFRLESPALPKTFWEQIHFDFEKLSDVEGFGPTGASKFLGALYPQLCVMWDKGIRRAYDHDRQPLYCCFLYEMHVQAKAIEGLSPGLSTTLSKELWKKPEYALATFINHYLWVTLGTSSTPSLPKRKKARCPLHQI